jgi:hypothetical protein
MECTVLLVQDQNHTKTETVHYNSSEKFSQLYRLYSVKSEDECGLTHWEECSMKQ